MSAGINFEGNGPPVVHATEGPSIAVEANAAPSYRAPVTSRKQALEVRREDVEALIQLLIDWFDAADRTGRENTPLRLSGEGL